MNIQNNNDIFIKFVESDFVQCFQQMRHYDIQIFDAVKFIFTGYIALIGIAIGLYQFETIEMIDLNYAIIVSLTIGLMLGFFVLALLIRNRVHYVQVTRYINEIRSYYYSNKPNEFENISGMYVNPNTPSYFNWKSTQLLLSYIITLLNTVIFCLIEYIFLKDCSFIIFIIIASSLAIINLQLLIAIKYLNAYETKRNNA